MFHTTYTYRILGRGGTVQAESPSFMGVHLAFYLNLISQYKPLQQDL